jgi:superfamily II DNA or RNA helicase
LPLRPYQEEAVEAVRAAIRSGRRRVLLVAPTGTGKTECYLAICHAAIARGNRVLVLASQEELLEQPGRKLDAAGQDFGVIQADHWRARPGLPLQLASVQTLSRRGVRPEASVVICDEAHLFVAETFSKIVADYPRAVILGLTATPRRLDGRGLGELFEELVIATTIERSIAEGWLVPVRTYAPSIPDLSAIKVSGGDFQRGAAGRLMEKPAIVGDVVSTWQKLAAGRSTIAFAADIAHSEKMVAAFRAAGISAAHVDGTTARGERARLLEELAGGGLQVLWNAQLLTLGIDVPRVSCIVMARPTLSETVYLQEGGRGLRPFPGKTDLLLLDHAGNCLRHGLLEWPREWSLAGVKRVKRDEKVPGLRLPCKTCFAVSPAGTLVCPGCGALFPKKPRIVVERPGELKSVTLAERGAHFSPEARVKALSKWIREGEERGYSPARAGVIFRKVFGIRPTFQEEGQARELAAASRRIA